MDIEEIAEQGIPNTDDEEGEEGGDIWRSPLRRGKVCKFYENYQALFGSHELVPPGVYTLDELKIHCTRFRLPEVNRPRPFCPYFTARRLLAVANVVVLNYQYVLDPKVSKSSLLADDTGVVARYGGVVGRVTTTLDNVKTFNVSLPPGMSSSGGAGGGKEPSIVVFDEAHNIDNVCIEALSININRQTLEASARNLVRLTEEIDNVKRQDTARLNTEYDALVRNLRDAGQIDDAAAEQLANPVLPSDIVEEAVPGSVRRATHFVSILKQVVVYLKNYIKVFEVKTEGPLSFLFHLQKDTSLDPYILKFTYERLKSLLNTLRIANLDEFTPLTLVADLLTLVATYGSVGRHNKMGSFVLITEPYPEVTGIYNPILQLCCVDASLAMRPVLDRYQSVILTSGTISPLDLYPKLLDFRPVLVESFPMSLDRNCICPLIISRGADQILLSSKFELRADTNVVRNYGQLLIDLTGAVPDGMVCFFTSYTYMEQVVSHWYDSGVLSRVLQNKLVFMETKDVVSTTLALHNFRKACDCGRGAVFLSVARGKVAEGIDFDRHYGRCVVLFGVPFQYTLSKVLKARLDFMRDSFQIQEGEFLTFDAMRQAAQCVGRVIRSKADYGLMVFADARYSRADKRSKLPPWILKYLDPTHIAMTTISAVASALDFLRNMSQPYTMTPSTRLTLTDLLAPVECWELVKRALQLPSLTLLDAPALHPWREREDDSSKDLSGPSFPTTDSGAVEGDSELLDEIPS